MNIYDIDTALTALVDAETGEISDYEAFAELTMECEVKIENTACWIKNLTAEAAAIREEEKALAERRQRCERKAERLKEYLRQALDGEKFETARCAVSYRRSKAVETTDAFIGWAIFNKRPDLYKVEIEPKKSAIKEALGKGLDCPYVNIVERTSVIIK